MKETLFNDIRKKQLLRTAMLWLAGVALFYAAVCTPVYVYGSGDVILSRDAIFTTLWEALMSVCSYLFYWGAFSCLLYALIRHGIRESKPFFGAIAGLSAVRYFANHIAGCFVMKFPSINDFFSDYLPYILLDIVFELLLITIAVVLMHIVLKNRLSIEATHAERTAFLSARFPLESLFDLKNPIGKAAILAALVPSTFMLVSRLIFDFSNGFSGGLVNLLWMVTFYLFDILSALIGYVVIIWIVHRIYTADLKAKKEFESD